MDALEGASVELPDPTAIIPYIGLFTLVSLDPSTTARNVIATLHLPGLSIIRDNCFEDAPANTRATAKDVARIFDSSNIEDDGPFSHGVIPLGPDVAGFEEKRYWQIPVFAGAIFAALMPRIQYDLSGCKDIELASKIVGHLMSKFPGGSGPSGVPSSGRGGGSGDGPSRGRGGGRGQPKRKNPSGEGGPSTERGKMNPRCVADGDGTGDKDECSNASGEALRPFPVPLGRYLNAGVPHYGLEIASSTRTLDDGMPAIDTNKENSDSEPGRSEHS